MDMTLEKKYIPLANYFSTATNPTITLQFTEIEKIMGQNLPHSAYLNRSWWKKTKAPAKHFQAWTQAGYTVKHVEPNRYVAFERIDLLNNREIEKSNEDILLIRSAAHGDARFLVELQKTTEGESDFLLYGKEESKRSIQKVRKQIIDWNQSGHSIIFLAILNGQHVGYLMIEGNSAKRAIHRANVLIAIQADAQGKGIASALLQKAEEWAIEKAIRRFELTVVEANIGARKLFEKNKYESEGIRRASLIIRDELHSEIYMAKILA